MTRVARIVVPGIPHHVTQRGVRRSDIFVTEDDRAFYLTNLRICAEKHGLEFWSYCLMTNHVHFIAVPQHEKSLGNTFHDAHGIYAMRFNELYGMSGALFEGRFHSSVMDESHTWSAIRYVERNPVRAGIVGRAAEYPWSSARAHCHGLRDHLLAKTFPMSDEIKDWSTWLLDDDDDFNAAFRKSTYSGRPLGGQDFLTRIEVILGRSLSPKPRGRKPGKTSTAIAEVA